MAIIVAMKHQTTAVGGKLKRKRIHATGKFRSWMVPTVIWYHFIFPFAFIAIINPEVILSITKVDRIIRQKIIAYSGGETSQILRIVSISKKMGNANNMLSIAPNLLVRFASNNMFCRSPRPSEDVISGVNAPVIAMESWFVWQGYSIDDSTPNLLW